MKRRMRHGASSARLKIDIFCTLNDIHEQPSNGSPTTINGSPHKDSQSHRHHHRLRDHRADPVSQRPVQLRRAFGHASGQSDDQRRPQCRHHQPLRRLALLADHDAVATDEDPKRQYVNDTIPTQAVVRCKNFLLKDGNFVAQFAGKRAKADIPDRLGDLPGR